MAARRREYAEFLVSEGSIAEFAIGALPARAASTGFYYLDHFRFALRWLHDRYGDLLSVRESKFIHEFAALPRASQALLVRFIMRRGQRFRASKVKYAEIGNIARACGPLIELQWVDPRPLLSIEELAKLITRSELIDLFPDLPAGVSKSQAIALLRATQGDERTFEDWRCGVSEPVYRVSIASLCTNLRLLFFGNFRQEWCEFVLSDLGIFRYETVPFSRESRAFQTRRDIEDFYLLYECRRMLAEEASPAEVRAMLPATSLQHEWLEARRARLQLQLARRYETAGERTQALALYEECRHRDARWRAIRMLEIDARYSEAYALASHAHQMPASHAEKQRLARALRRLERRLGMPARARQEAALPQRMDLIVPAPLGGECVERIALKLLAVPQGPVYFVENALINSLFGLLCWDAIFAPVSGAFFHAFQAAPMDLFSRTFQQRRAALFDRAFASLESDAYKEIIEHNFHAKRGIQSSFVAWGVLDEELLRTALGCIPATHLRRYFERLLSNLPDNRTGLPDLVQFWVDEKRYRMIEVKGPGDRLQDNQQRWMQFCLEQNLPVAICHVRWQSGNAQHVIPTPPRTL
jgi:hypothetical protein